MTSITQAADGLITNPMPILCLDTCDFLDVVRSFAADKFKETNLFNAESFRKVLQELTTKPDRFQVVITYLVRHEWHQSISANKADFWANRDTPALHPDLENEAQVAGLRFFGRLDEALRSLGI